MFIKSFSIALPASLLALGSAQAQTPAVPAQPASAQPASAQPASAQPASAQPASAQPAATGAAPTDTAPVVPATRSILLPPNSEVVVTPNDTLNTKTAKQGDKVRLSTVMDVMQDGFVVIPRGTPGEATISYLTKKGAFGKSGKLEVEFNTLDLGGRKIVLTGKYRQDGEGNTGATVGAVVAVGVFAAFVTGHSATLTNGQQLRAHTAEPVTFTVPADAPRILTATLAPAASPAAPTPAAPAPAAPAPAAPKH